MTGSLTYTLLVSAVLMLCIRESYAGPAIQKIAKKWLKQKRKQDKVVERPSGLLYRHQYKGQGVVHPSFDTYCEISYEISTVLSVDGTEMKLVDQDDLGMVRPVDQIPAIREALELMVVGDWLLMYVPPKLGYSGKFSRNRPKKVYGDEALYISLKLTNITAGDTYPKGEEHNCYVGLDWDESTAQYGHKPLGKSCNEKEVGYIEKVSGWESRSLKADQELTRLRSVLKEGGAAPNLAQWVRGRMHILKQFLLEEVRICSIFYVNTPDRGLVLYQEDCNAQEQEYVAKVQDWGVEQIEVELKRLDGLDQGSVDRFLASWIRRRIRILNQMKALRASRPEAPEGEKAEDAPDEGKNDAKEEAPEEEKPDLKEEL